MVKATRGPQIYEGKAKILFEGPKNGTLIQYFKDTATAGNGKKLETISGKGVLNNLISAALMAHIQQMGIPTHFIKQLNMREQLVRSVDVIPLEVVIRNIAAGSITRRLGVEEGKRLPCSIIEFYYKDDSLGDPLVTEEHILAFDWASGSELEKMTVLAYRINDFLQGFFSALHIRLVDFKLEFGRLWDNDVCQVALADEISPDNCRLWDCQTSERLDKDRFRRDLGSVKEAYQEIARRMGLMTQKGNVVDIKNGKNLP